MALHKILKIVALILSVLGIVFLAMLIAKGDETIKATGEGVDGYLYTAYIIFALVLLFVIVFVLKGIFAGNIKKTLLSVGVFLLIAIIGYVLADGSDYQSYTIVDDSTELTESTSKWVGAGLYAFYILAILAIGAMIFSGIKKMTSR